MRSRHLLRLTMALVCVQPHAAVHHTVMFDEIAIPTVASDCGDGVQPNCTVSDFFSSNSLNVTPGDIVQFAVHSDHDLWTSIDATDYSTCTGDDELVQLVVSGAATWELGLGTAEAPTLTTSDIGTTRYFICEVPGHCAAGQHLAVTVVAPTTASPSASPTTAAPSSSPTTAAPTTASPTESPTTAAPTTIDNSDDDDSGGGGGEVDTLVIAAAAGGGGAALIAAVIVYVLYGKRGRAETGPRRSSPTSIYGSKPKSGKMKGSKKVAPREGGDDSPGKNYRRSAWSSSA